MDDAGDGPVAFSWVNQAEAAAGDEIAAAVARVCRELDRLYGRDADLAGELGLDFFEGRLRIPWHLVHRGNGGELRRFFDGCYRNKERSRHRRAGRRPRPNDGLCRRAADPRSSTARRVAQAESFDELLDLVKPKCRALIEDRFVAGMTWAEIASRHGLPSGDAARKRVARARKNFEVALCRRREPGIGGSLDGQAKGAGDATASLEARERGAER